MTTKGELLQAIHDHCLECCGSYRDVQTCPGSEMCRIWNYRLGKDPTPARQAPEELIAASRRRGKPAK